MNVRTRECPLRGAAKGTLAAAVPGPNRWHSASLAGREANVQGLGAIRLQASDTLETGEILKLVNGATGLAVMPTCMKVVWAGPLRSSG